MNLSKRKPRHLITVLRQGKKTEASTAFIHENPLTILLFSYSMF